MAVRWKTFIVSPEGGLFENLPPLVQGISAPGSLIDAINFEPSSGSGYTRITGFSKYSSTEVTGTGDILGCFVFNGKVLACRNNDIYESSGGAWASIKTQTNAPVKYLGHIYNWSSDKIVLVDGANDPITYDGTTVTTLTGVAPSDLLGAVDVHSFQRHMFFAKDNNIIFSRPNDETLYDAAGGGGIINVGHEVIGLGVWRESLYIFGPNNISRLRGTSAADFVLDSITTKLGCVDQRTIKELSSDLYFVSWDGVRTVAGTERNDDLNLESLTKTIPETIEGSEFRSSTTDTTAVVVSRKDQYRVFIGKGSYASDTQAVGLLGGLRLRSDGTLNMEWYKTKGFNCSCTDSLVEGEDEVVIHGGYDGFIYQQESGNDFDGSSVLASIRFPHWSFDDSELRKTLYKTKVYIESSGVIDPTLTYLYDFLTNRSIQPPAIPLGSGVTVVSTYGGSGTTYGTAAYSEGVTSIVDINLVGSGDNVSFQISSDDTNGPYTVRDIVVEYGLKDRR